EVEHADRHALGRSQRTPGSGLRERNGGEVLRPRTTREEQAQERAPGEDARTDHRTPRPWRHSRAAYPRILTTVTLKFPHAAFLTGSLLTTPCGDEKIRAPRLVDDSPHPTADWHLQFKHRHQSESM